MSKIIVIDDDKDICKMIARVLSKEGHQIDIKHSAENIPVDYFSEFDLLLLDVMMPGIDGFSFCRKIRDFVDLPILFITAKSLEEDLVEGLGVGGDDYITKPFSILELRARVKAHLQREKWEYLQGFRRGDYYFNLSSLELFLKKEDKEIKIPLTKGEYDIWEFLGKNQGQVFTLEKILESVFGYESDSDIQAIRVHIKNIRKKFKQYDKNPIETIWGVGYKWIK